MCVCVCVYESVCVCVCVYVTHCRAASPSHLSAKVSEGGREVRASGDHPGVWSTARRLVLVDLGGGGGEEKGGKRVWGRVEREAGGGRGERRAQKHYKGRPPAGGAVVSEQ